MKRPRADSQLSEGHRNDERCSDPSEESAREARTGVSVICYAVFRWTLHREVPPDVQRALSGSHHIMFRISVWQFLTDEDVACVRLCCKDALEHVDLLTGPDPHEDEYEQWCQSSDYDSE